jgi:cardiolipin synthase
VRAHLAGRLGRILAALALPVALAACHPGFAATPAGAPASLGPLITEPDERWAAVRQFITTAQHTLDMTMYELDDTTAEQNLADLAARGVTVRVILDHNREAAHNQPAFDFLAHNHVHVVWAPTGFRATHQKTITVDRGAALILSGNLTSRYYATGRDVGVLDRDPADVAAIERTFDGDFTGTPVTPSSGTGLVWSPTTSQASLLQLIGSATTTLAVENEEMADPAIVTALATAARRGVTVTVTMTSNPSWNTNFATLTRAGVRVATYSTSARLYIHAKIVLVDAGTPQGRGFLGSQNFSTASLRANRELGLITTNAAILRPLAATVSGDLAGATPWRG